MINYSQNFKTQFKNNIFSTNEISFHEKALELFQFQAYHCPVYRDFLKNLKVHPEDVVRIEDIPFLPIEMFRKHKVLTEPNEGIDVTFRSSGTTDQNRSSHYVMDLSLYEQSCIEGFRQFWGDPANYVILALLPDYLERKDASLVWMVKKLMDYSGNEESGFFLHDLSALKSRVEALHDRQILLIGVSFALLDLAEEYQIDLSEHTVMETGGMKGRRKELVREELHQRIQSSLGCNQVASEYGMTELLSQAYSEKEGFFSFPPWAKAIIRDPYDPFNFLAERRNGAINVIDLANVDSCAFLATSDLGKKYRNGSFEVLGRMDNSDLRGCNLLFE